MWCVSSNTGHFRLISEIFFWWCDVAPYTVSVKGEKPSQKEKEKQKCEKLGSTCHQPTRACWWFSVTVIKANQFSLESVRHLLLLLLRCVCVSVCVCVRFRCIYLPHRLIDSQHYRRIFECNMSHITLNYIVGWRWIFSPLKESFLIVQREHRLHSISWRLIHLLIFHWKFDWLHRVVAVNCFLFFVPEEWNERVVSRWNTPRVVTPQIYTSSPDYSLIFPRHTFTLSSKLH